MKRVQVLVVLIFMLLGGCSLFRVPETDSGRGQMEEFYESDGEPGFVSFDENECVSNEALTEIGDDVKSLRNSSIDKITQSINGLGYKVLSTINKDEPEKNIFISPYSLHQALAILSRGASGATKDEFIDTFDITDFEKYPEEIKNYNAALYHNIEVLKPNIEISKLKKKEIDSESVGDIPGRIMQLCKEELNAEHDCYPELTIANGIWYNGLAKDIFRNEIRNYFNGEKLPSSWREDEINKWVSEKTKGKILDIVKKEDMESCMIILNTIYFKSGWDELFNSSRDRVMPFFVNDEKAVKVKYMSISDLSTNYYSDEYCEVFQLDYTGNKHSMLIVLPKYDVKIDDFIKICNEDYMDNVKKNFKKSNFGLKMPRFTLENTYSLLENLRNNGLKNSMSRQANYSRMYNGSVVVSKVVQKSYLDVNEKGSEAAAVTKICICPRGGHWPKPEKNITVDRPFMLYIIDNDLGVNLFSGVVKNPLN